MLAWRLSLPLLALRLDAHQMTNPPKSNPSTDDGHQKITGATPAITGDNSTETGSSELSEFPRFHRFWGRVKKMADLIGPFALIIGAVYGVITCVDLMIGWKLSDETILRKIAMHSRPSIIFNGKESIIADMGAGPFIKDIQISKKTAEGLPQHIIVDFTRHFATAPILTPLYDTVQISAERGKLFAWEFDIHWGSIMPLNPGDKNRLYRLEIVW